MVIRENLQFIDLKLFNVECCGIAEFKFIHFSIKNSSIWNIENVWCSEFDVQPIIWLNFIIIIIIMNSDANYQNNCFKLPSVFPNIYTIHTFKWWWCIQSNFNQFNNNFYTIIVEINLSYNKMVKLMKKCFKFDWIYLSEALR